MTKLVDADSSDIDYAVPDTGSTDLRVVETVPPGIKRRLTFGYLNLIGGTARNFQLFVRDRNNRNYAISDNDSNSKNVEGFQWLKEGQSIVAVVAAGAAADSTTLNGSVSYEDYQ